MVFYALVSLWFYCLFRAKASSQRNAFIVECSLCQESIPGALLAALDSRLSFLPYITSQTLGVMAFLAGKVIVL